VWSPSCGQDSAEKRAHLAHTKKSAREEVARTLFNFHSLSWRLHNISRTGDRHPDTHEAHEERKAHTCAYARHAHLHTPEIGDEGREGGGGPLRRDSSSLVRGIGTYSVLELVHAQPDLPAEPAPCQLVRRRMSTRLASSPGLNCLERGW
jgi:hypothetical protein